MNETCTCHPYVRIWIVNLQHNTNTIRVLQYRQ